MECLDANAVQDFMAGALDSAARATAIAHLDGCADCRDLISMLARAATHDAAIDTLRGADRRAGVALVETAVTDGPRGAADAGRTPEELSARSPRIDPLGETAAVTSSAPTQPQRITTPSHTGRALGRYTVAERLGAGAMGVVYRADDHELRRSVALKLLHRPDHALTERLIREARSMAQVNHPNVVTIYDVGVADGLTYIAMELVSGGSLRAWLAGDRTAGTRTIPEVVEAYVAAGRGLAAAHAAGVVHRDFKPDNVLVGADGRVRVTDFGLASARPTEPGPGAGRGSGRSGQETGAPGSMTRGPSGQETGAPGSMTRGPDELGLTSSGMVLGTPAYMAPEQFTGGNIDPRTDQFNFCVALYEALYGHRPFAGKTFDELGNNVCDGKVRAAPAKTRVSAGLRAIVLRGLASRPGDRYPTMDHLLEQLGRDRAKPWRRATFAAAAVCVALAIGLVADLVVRDRTGSEISQSFTLTGRQTNRAIELLASRFDAAATQVYFLPVMRQVSGNRDQADFGLGTKQTDDENLERLHHELASVDWTLPREIAGKRYDPVIAIADYKGRLLFTSALPSHWLVDLTTLPWVKSALDGKARTLVLVAANDPQLAATGVAGKPPPGGLAICFTRTLLLGGEAASQLLYIADAAHLLDEIRLDNTLLAIVALDGTAIGDVPADLVTSASLDTESVTELATAGTSYLVSAQPIRGFDGAIAGHLVMARTFEGVLSLFPGARIVFALTLLAGLAVTGLAAMRARRIANARV